MARLSRIRRVETFTMAAVVLLAGARVLADELWVPPPPVHAAVTVTAPLQRPRPMLPERAPPAPPAAEPTAPSAPAAATANAEWSNSAFTAADSPKPLTTGLTAPVSINYSGASVALGVTDTGTSDGIVSWLTNSANTASAIYGQNAGSGAGVAGYNVGTGGPGGYFQVSNTKSSQAAVSANTKGTGPAVLGTVTNISPAVYGKNLVSQPSFAEMPIGVEGDGYYGVYGYSPYGGAGVYGLGAGSGTGVSGQSYAGVGVGAGSGTFIALQANSESGTAIYAESESGPGIQVSSASNTAIQAESYGTADGIKVHSAGGTGIYAISDTQQGVFGQSKNSYGVVGEDSGSGVGVYGSSVSGYAGFFNGKVIAASYVTLSDRDAKSDIKPIDGRDILDRVDRLPIASWVFKSDPKRNHVGPMAQDFHAAFGLDGNDDKHINLTDMAGVSLAAIQELDRQVKEQDAQIAALQADKDAQIAALQADKDAQIAALQADNDAQIAALKADNDAQIAELKSQLAALAAMLSAHGAALENRR